MENDTRELTRAAAEQRALEPKPPAPVPQYATGFEGAAQAPFAPEAVAVLSAPVAEHEVELRADGIVYMPGVWYRRTLTRAFGAGAWALLPRGPARSMGDIIVYHGALYVLGRFVSEAHGECETRQGMSYASALEGARTDCLTRCCKDLGMAAELWDPAWRDSWLKKYADREWAEGKGDRKGKWRYWLKDQAGTGALVEGRNVGSPKGEAPAGTAVALPAVTTVAAPASATAPTSPDTAEPADETTVAGIRQVVSKLAWKSGYAKIWLKGTFGVEAPDRLTKTQAADALELLRAFQANDGELTYQEVRARLAAVGRVKTTTGPGVR